MTAGYVHLILRYFTEQSEKYGKQTWPTHLTLQQGADMKLRNKTRETVCLREDDLL